MYVPWKTPRLADFRGSDRDESFWVHHHDQSCAAILPGAARWAHHPGYIDRRTNWADRTRNRTQQQSSASRLLGITVQRDRTPRLKVTIVEPGGFRNRFCGHLHGPSRRSVEYDATVGATVRFQRDYDGKQTGGPSEGGRGAYAHASLSDPPLRLLLGSDSYKAAEQAALRNSRWTENGRISATQLTTHPAIFLPDDALCRRSVEC